MDKPKRMYKTPTVSMTYLYEDVLKPMWASRQHLRDKKAAKIQAEKDLPKLFDVEEMGNEVDGNEVDGRE